MAVTQADPKAASTSQKLQLLCLVRCRCGPMGMALSMMEQHAELRSLLDAMLQHQLPLKQGVEALTLAQSKGVLKVQLVMR